MAHPQFNRRASVVLEAAMHFAYAGELRDQVNAATEEIDFAGAIRRALDKFNITPEAVASQFGVTRATVSRWKNGEAVPGAYMRKEVLVWLASAIEENSPVEEVKNRLDELIHRAQHV